VRSTFVPCLPELFRMSLNYPALPLLYRLAADVHVCRASRLVTFQSRRMDALNVPTQTESFADALLSLTGPGVGWRGLTLIAAREGGSGIPEALEACLDLLLGRQMLELVWFAGGVERAVISSFCPGFRFSETRLWLDSEVVLSRFAYVRRDGARTVLESPEALCRLEFTCLQTWYSLGLLARPTSIAAARQSGHNDLVELAMLLWSTGFLERTNAAEAPARASWEFQDLLFHWRTRGGRVTGLQGGTFRFMDMWSPPPAAKAPMSADAVPLPASPEANLESASVATVMERRRSVRDQGEPPITLEQIARILYHTLRVQQSLPGDCEELLLRPVPAAGAIHEIELYLAVGRCCGLKRGLYHYSGVQHKLYRLPAGENELAALLRDAALAWAKPDDPPQVLVILASRFPRLAWKYEGIAYRLTLLNAGVIFQSIYLLATEMGLACSAIGGGDSEVFAAATGLDPMAETSIAEFALGSLASSKDDAGG
jgi:SagB-type dehydrogenase family enzyme